MHGVPEYCLVIGRLVALLCTRLDGRYRVTDGAVAATTNVVLKVLLLAVDIEVSYVC